MARQSEPGAHRIWRMVFLDELIRDAMNRTHLTLPMPRNPEDREACERFVHTFNKPMGKAYKVSFQVNFVVCPE